MTKILCIDDDINLLQTIKDYLFDENYEAYGADRPRFFVPG